MTMNDTCFPVDPLDILPDGTPCIQGFCNQVTPRTSYSLGKKANYHRMTALSLCYLTKDRDRKMKTWHGGSLFMSATILCLRQF